MIGDRHRWNIGAAARLGVPRDAFAMLVLRVDRMLHIDSVSAFGSRSALRSNRLGLPATHETNLKSVTSRHSCDSRCPRYEQAHIVRATRCIEGRIDLRRAACAKLACSRRVSWTTCSPAACA